MHKIAAFFEGVFANFVYVAVRADLLDIRPSDVRKRQQTG